MQVYDDVRQRLARGEMVLLDGGIGSELVRQGVRWRGHGLRTDGAAVQALHQAYLAAGADLIRTNTFQLNRRIYLNVFRDLDHLRQIGAPGLETRAAELTRRAVELAQAARAAAERPEVPIAGVMSPLEHCYRPDLSPGAAALEEQVECATLLAAAGVDLLLVEAVNRLDEAEVAVRAALATGLPVWVSLCVDEPGTILSGEPLDEVAWSLRQLGVELVLLTGGPPELVSAGVELLAKWPDDRFGAYAQVGWFDPPSWKLEFHPNFSNTEAWPPERYAAQAERWRERGAAVLGGSHGTGPEHIRALKAALAARS